MVVSLKRLIKQITALVVIPTMALSLTGCELALFDDAGFIGQKISSTMIYTVLLMLIVVIPTIFLAVYIPYKYRTGNDSNTEADYKPEWSHSTAIEFIVWGIPIFIIILLAVETYKTSHSLDPHREIAPPAEAMQERPLKIQVVALDWKWLFIYPEEGIATVNEIAIPVNQPVQFLLTSDGAINSFFIPRLGGQLYAMAGMENKLNLMAVKEGTYQGQSSNYSGFGFTNMRFKVHAVDKAGFKKWVADAQNSPNTLNDATYNELATEEHPHACGKLYCRRQKPYPVTYYVNPNPLRFKEIIDENIGLNNRPVEVHGSKAHGTEAEGEHGQAESHGESGHGEISIYKIKGK